MCGSDSAKRSYVDPDVYYEWVGNVYFCTKCMEEIAAATGCLTADESEFLKEQNSELAEQNASLREQLDVAVGNLTSIRSVLVDAVNSSGLDLTEGPVENESGESVNSNEPASSGTGEEPESPEPIKERRSNDAPRPTKRDTAEQFDL